MPENCRSRPVGEIDPQVTQAIKQEVGWQDATLFLSKFMPVTANVSDDRNKSVQQITHNDK